VKAGKHHTTPLPRQKKSSRGRPTKISRRRVLELGGEPLSLEFRFRPLRCPVDAQFVPYYDRILKGDLSAVSDYVERNAARRDLDPSFYELLGRLVTIRFYAAADQVLSDVERRGNIGYPTDEQVSAYWYGLLLPLANQAKKWIREYLKNLSGKWNRAEAWYRYAEETCKDDWEQCAKYRELGLPDLPLVCNLERHRVIYYQSERPLWRQDYMQLRLVPKEIFWSLAERRGSATRASWAVRKYLRDWDADIKARLKNVRQKKSLNSDTQ